MNFMLYTAFFLALLILLSLFKMYSTIIRLNRESQDRTTEFASAMVAGQLGRMGGKSDNLEKLRKMDIKEARMRALRSFIRWGLLLIIATPLCLWSYDNYKEEAVQLLEEYKIKAQDMISDNASGTGSVKPGKGPQFLTSWVDIQVPEDGIIVTTDFQNADELVMTCKSGDDSFEDYYRDQMNTLSWELEEAGGSAGNWTHTWKKGVQKLNIDAQKKSDEMYLTFRFKGVSTDRLRLIKQ